MARTVSLPFITKVLPPVLPRYAVRRNHLLTSLQAGLERHLQILWAPAGFGKTTLLAELEARQGGPVCWYTCAAEDHSPHDLVAYWAGAFADALRLNKGTSGPPRLSPGVSWQQSLGHLITWLNKAVRDRALFIIDDAHHLDSKPFLWDVVSLFIERAPASVRFIVSSRTKPSLTCVPRLELQGNLAWFTAETLRFSREETEAFLAESWGRAPSPQEVEELLAETSGWPAGLVLLARPQASGLGRMATSLPRDSVLFDYLTQDVVRQLPQELQQFLLRTSVLREFTTELCDRLLVRVDSAAAVDGIKARNLFLEERSGPPPTYRYHDLFRRHLLRQLQQEFPKVHLDLRRRAAQIFKAQGVPQEAVEHLVAGGMLEEAIALVKQSGQAYFEAGAWNRLNTLLALLPQESLMQDGELLLMKGRMLLRVNDPSSSLSALDKAFSLCRSSDGTLRGRVLVAQSHAYRLLGQTVKAIEVARQGVEKLKGVNAQSADLAEAYRQLASALAAKGEFGEALASFHLAFGLVDEGHLETFCLVCDGLGALHIERGELDQAKHYLERARQGWSKLENRAALGYTLNNLAIVHLYEGDFEAGLVAAQEAVKVARDTGFLAALALAQVTEGILRRAMGNHHDALSPLEQGLQLAQELLHARLVAEATCALAHTHRLLGDPARAESLLHQALTEAEHTQQGYALARYHLALARVMCQQERYEEGLEHTTLAIGQFRRSESRRALAEARFVQAMAYYRSGQVRSCAKALEHVAELVAELGYHGFLLVDGGEALEVFQFGAVKRIGGDLFSRLVQRLCSSPRQGMKTGRRSMLTPSLPRLRVIAFGAPEVWLEHHKVSPSEWQGAKTQELFYLLLTAKRPVTADAITDALWPEAAISARKALKMTVYRVRQALYPESLLSKEGRYWINPAVPLEFDVDMFNRCLREAETFARKPGPRLTRIRKAIALYTGPFLAGLDAGWCADMRYSLEVKYEKALVTQAVHHLDQQDISRAKEPLQRCLETNPYNEEARYLLARAHLDSGDPQEALAEVRRFQELAKSELGITVSPQWQTLYRQAFEKVLTH